MSLLRPAVGGHVSELTTTLMKSLSRQVAPSLDPLVSGPTAAVPGVGSAGSTAITGQGGQVRPAGSAAPIVPPVMEPPAVPAAQQLSADDRMRALAQLQRIVSAVAAEQPALPAVKEPDAPLPPADKAVAAPMQMPADAAGPAVKKRPRERPLDEDPVEEERVAVWNQATGKKLTGQAAPKRKNLEKYLRQHPDFSVLYEDGAPSAAAAAANAAANAEASGMPARGDHLAQKRPRQPQQPDGLLRARQNPQQVAVTPPLVPTVFEPLPLDGRFERLSPLMGKGTPDFGAFDGFSLWCRPRLEPLSLPTLGPELSPLCAPRRHVLHGNFMMVAASSFSHAHTHLLCRRRPHEVRALPIGSAGRGLVRREGLRRCTKK